MSEDVYILGAGMIKFGKFLERSVKDMTGLVLEEVLEDCGLAGRHPGGLVLQHHVGAVRLPALDSRTGCSHGERAAGKSR